MSDSVDENPLVDVPNDTLSSNLLYREGGKLYETPSMCMYCHSEGITKILLTKIPLFKEVIISSFECPSCFYKENDIRSASGIADIACVYSLSIDVLNQEEEIIQKNLNRQLVRSETVLIRIPEIDFEIEPNRSEIITVEGLLRNIRESLTAGQEDRQIKQPQAYERIGEIIDHIQMFEEGKDSFTLVLDDKGGNSFIENPWAPAADPYCTIKKRYRTVEENISLGYTAEDSVTADTADDSERPLTEEEKEEVIRRAIEDVSTKNQSIERSIAMDKLTNFAHENMNELYNVSGRGDSYKSGGSKAALNIMSATMMNKKPMDRFEAIRENRDLQTAVFRDRCHECGRTNETRMLLFEIPYFNTIIIMCTDCLYCGFKHSEIKPGGGYADKGQKIQVAIESPDDLSRDVLKSDHAGIVIPEIDCELEYGTLGGKFTTIEGILLDVRGQLEGSRSLYTGDSSDDVTRDNFTRFIQALNDCLSVKKPFTFVLDDPSGGSFIEGREDGKPDSDPYKDTKMVIENYVRSKEQDDLLGISDMITENYEEELAIKKNVTKSTEIQQ